MELYRELYEKHVGFKPVSRDAIAAVYHNNYLIQKTKHKKKKKDEKED